MSAVNPDPGLERVEALLRQRGDYHRSLATRASGDSVIALYRRWRLACFHFQGLCPEISGRRRDQLVDLAISYYKDPSRYA